MRDPEHALTLGLRSSIDRHGARSIEAKDTSRVSLLIKEGRSPRNKFQSMQVCHAMAGAIFIAAQGVLAAPFDRAVFRACNRLIISTDRPSH